MRACDVALASRCAADCAVDRARVSMDRTRSWRVRCVSRAYVESRVRTRATFRKLWPQGTQVSATNHNPSLHTGVVHCFVHSACSRVMLASSLGSFTRPIAPTMWLGSGPSHPMMQSRRVWAYAHETKRRGAKRRHDRHDTDTSTRDAAVTTC